MDNSKEPVDKNNKDSHISGQNEILKAEVAGRVVRPSVLKSKKIRVILLVLFLAVIGGVILSLTPEDKNKGDDNPVIFSIDDKEFRASEVNPYLESASQYSVDDKTALEGLITAMKYKILAEKYNIQISDEQKREALKETALGESAKQSEKLNSWLDIVGLRIFMEDYLRKSTSGSKQGYSYVFYFGNLIIPNNLDENFPNFGDQDLIKRDKDYAQKKAEEAYEALKSGKTKAEDLLNSLTADSMLNYGYFDDSSYSTKFGNNESGESWEYEVSFDDIISTVKEIKEINKPSEIKTGKIAITEAPESDEDYKEAYYYFVYMTDTGDKSKDIQSTFDNMKVIKP